MRWKITGQPGSHREVSLGHRRRAVNTPSALGTKGNRELLAKTDPPLTKDSNVRTLKGSKLG